MSTTIHKITVRDARYTLQPGEGVDAVHSAPQYSYAVCLLHSDSGLTGSGLAFTLGPGNDLVCAAIQELAKPLAGRQIEEVMADFGATFRKIADHPQYRWLGPHKGVVHLALAAITNACFDLWAKARGVPLWQLLLDLSPEALVNTLDLSYFEDVLTRFEAIALVRNEAATRDERTEVLQRGYRGYDTSVGWFNYSDDQIRENAKRALDAGFMAMKLKVGSPDPERDIRRTLMVRETVGDGVQIMVDCNQQWTLPTALRVCLRLAEMNPYWVEEPTHPDDVLAHQTLARAIAPIKIAAGEHLPNRILFKNYIQAGAMHFVQADAVRIGGVSEFLTVSLLARKFNLPIVPHVGDMGQLHQHLVLFNRIGLNMEEVLLEYIPHLRQHFVHPAIVANGVYQTPQEAGSSSDLKEE